MISGSFGDNSGDFRKNCSCLTDTERSKFSRVVALWIVLFVPLWICLRFYFSQVFANDVWYFSLLIFSAKSSQDLIHFWFIISYLNLSLLLIFFNAKLLLLNFRGSFFDFVAWLLWKLLSFIIKGDKSLLLYRKNCMDIALCIGIIVELLLTKFRCLLLILLFTLSL